MPTPPGPSVERPYEFPLTFLDRLRSAGCVFAEDELAALRDWAGGDSTRLATGVDRRAAGEPLELVVGHVDFSGLRLRTAAGVFVPRQRTALLVEVAGRRAVDDAVVCDVGTGGGAIAAALLARHSPRLLLGTDLDLPALRLARTNTAGRARLVACDLLAGLSPRLAGRVDLITACLPYVPSDQLARLPREARDHEPVLALDGGPDGLRLIGRLAAQASWWLTASGAMCLEVGPAQVERLEVIARQHALALATVQDDDTGGCVVVLTRSV